MHSGGAAILRWTPLLRHGLSRGARQDCESEHAIVAQHLESLVFHATLTVVGKRFGRDVATLSTTIRRLMERAERSKTLKMRMTQLESILNVTK